MTDSDTAHIVVAEDREFPPAEKNEVVCPECFWTNGVFRTEDEWKSLLYAPATVNIMKERQEFESWEDLLKRNPNKYCPMCKSPLNCSKVVL